MAKNFTELDFNNTINPVGPFSLDKRAVVDSIEKLFISDETRNRESAIEGLSLFNLVYPGMIVSVRRDAKTPEGKPYYEVYVCDDNSPYLPGSEIVIEDVSALDEYWTKIGG